MATASRALPRSAWWLAALLAALPSCSSPTPAAPPLADRGRELYERHCTACHGEDGDADTVVADFLMPRPTPFRLGLWKLVGTSNGAPTDDDLVATLRRGMPGSTMMAYGWLPDDDLQALARHVRRLAVIGRAEAIHALAQRTGQPLGLDEATATAERQLAAGATVAVGTPASLTVDTLAAGELLYRQHCASCHGTDGRGLPQLQDWPTDGTWLWPRDFTAGWLRGDASHRSLAFRIRAGMPGAHMPPTRLSDVETAALVGYVKSLIPDAAGDRHVQWRRTVRVPRLAQLPDDATFATGDAVELPTVPLWWHPQATTDCAVRAAHDGRDLVLQVQWADATHNDTITPQLRLGDGIAVQFTADADPPLFAMGTRASPVNAWRWQAYEPKELAGMADLVGRPLHAGLDVPTGTGVTPRTESVALGGLHDVGARTGTGLPLQATASWRDGTWTATFRRSLAARAGTEIDLQRGPVLFAIALWNGSLDRHAGSKVITTWHRLELQ